MIRLLIVGTGGMARAHAEAYQEMEGVTVVGSVDINAEALASFNKDFGIENGFSSVEDALKWGEFDAVSNVTPDAIHRRTTLPFLKAGKHVLCEKPLATSEADANEMTTAAQQARVVNMVNLTYRNVPALIHAAQLVAEGRIGDVRHFEASYLQSWLTQDAWGHWADDPQWLWRLSTAHGSMGVLGDVGVHIVDFATFVAGAAVDKLSCRLQTFEKVKGNEIWPYRLDANDSMAMHLQLSTGAIGVIHATRFASGHLNDLRLRIYGTKGGLDVRFEKGQSRLSISEGEALKSGEWFDLTPPDVPTNYQRFVQAIRDGTQVLPDFARGANLQRVLDLAVLSNEHGAADQQI
ncbi:Gfo/Idh/MocA family protein [Yoonia litorea]|uniref:Predicted dehydrogenase n=1 Tax=Yoonia litorea TaxID=1123755 RepID=A0A1I6MUA2_9RHOB|nr:Gfo/Idh/MocA family oxidoreductase [Yoonia litorea]SFS19306.1 Predicted dehydrogenase [Yoonia litorea]